MFPYQSLFRKHGEARSIPAFSLEYQIRHGGAHSAAALIAPGGGVSELPSLRHEYGNDLPETNTACN
jgi:hypothetical protein